MNRLITCGATAAFALLNILSCSDATTPDGLSADDLSADPNRIIGSIVVSFKDSTISVGETTQATAAVFDRRGRPLDRSVTWSSSNTAIASVTDSGLVTGVAQGQAVITASHNGHSGSATVTVNNVGTQTVTPVASVLVALAATSISIGQSTQATATARDSAGNTLTGRTITWASSDSSVAIVSDSGKVTGLTSGSAQILASSEGKSGSAALTVTSAPAPSNPGTVTDLKLVSVDSNSAALSFTQVDDGTGQPAKYDVRYAVSPISWGSATSTTSGSCKTPVSGTAIGATLNCTVAGLTASTGYQFQLIAFRGTLNQNAVFGGVSNVVSATTTAGSSPPPPPPPPPGGSVEPPGMTLQTDRPFSALDEGWGAAWDEGGGGGPGNFSITTDATAPQSPSSVGQMKFPVGLVGGYPPAVVGTSFSGTPRTLYISMWVKFSTNWIGNSGSGGGKITHIWINGVNRIYTYANGVSGPLSPWINLQQLAKSYDPRPQGGQGSGASVNLPPNVSGQTGVQLVRGQWYKWEMVIYGGSAGGSDGTVDWWINGTQVGHYTGVPFVAAGGNNYWEMIEWNPTWGGLGGTISSVQYQWMDHIYISGKP